jgi:hypothetical protein
MNAVVGWLVVVVCCWRLACQKACNVSCEKVDNGVGDESTQTFGAQLSRSDSVVDHDEGDEHDHDIVRENKDAVNSYYCSVMGAWIYESHRHRTRILFGGPSARREIRCHLSSSSSAAASCICDTGGDCCVGDEMSCCSCCC